MKNDNVVRLAVDSLSNERALVYQQEWVFMYSLKFHGRIFSKKKPPDILHKESLIRRMTFFLVVKFQSRTETPVHEI